MKRVKLTKEEKDLEKSLSTDNWGSAANNIIEETKHIAAAAVKARKEARINIRLENDVVETLKKIADREGLGYQTLMGSVLKKFATGLLIDRILFEELITRVAPGRKKKAA